MPGYTHGHHESVLRSHRRRTAADSAAYLLPLLAPGQHLLDVGCGPGTITADLAAHVLPGRVVAIEPTSRAIGIARAELARRGCETVEPAVGDVHALPFGDGAFDVVHAHQVLQHVPDPVQALHEMRRVCRPGGIVAVRDSDYGAFAWYPESPELSDWLTLYRSAARRNGGQPDAGRHLLSWARAAGFTDITPTSSTWCFATPDERQWWGTMWADRILQSDLAGQLLRDGAADEQRLTAISAAWRQWAANPDGWLSLLHGELICRP